MMMMMMMIAWLQLDPKRCYTEKLAVLSFIDGEFKACCVIGSVCTHWHTSRSKLWPCTTLFHLTGQSVKNIFYAKKKKKKDGEGELAAAESCYIRGCAVVVSAACMQMNKWWEGLDHRGLGKTSPFFFFFCFFCLNNVKEHWGQVY